MGKRLALLSAFDKGGVVDFARFLHERGDWEILSSGGTAKVIAEAGIPVISVEEFTGMGPVLDHRVVTLQPQIHGGLLATDSEAHKTQLEELGWRRIDLAYVDLYPLEREVEREEATLESVLEKTDIGGPTMLRAAAKGRRIVISRQDQLQKVQGWIANGEPNQRAVMAGLCYEAESRVRDYCAASAGWHEAYAEKELLAARAEAV